MAGSAVVVDGLADGAGVAAGLAGIV